MRSQHDRHWTEVLSTIGEKARARRARRSGSVGWMALTLAMAGCGAIPAVDVVPDGPLVTTEAGSSVALAVTLQRRPWEALELYAVSSNEAEGLVVGDPARIDASNWDQTQTIRVFGVDDARVDADASYDVTIYLRRSRQPSEPVAVASLHFVNRDDDQVRFDALGDLPGGEQASYVSAVSAAGDVVVGYSRGDSGDQAVRWTPERGLEGLGGADSRARGVSPDGSLVVGSIAYPENERGRAAALWAGDAPLSILQTTAPASGAPRPFVFIDATAVLDDGLVFGTCIQFAAYGEPIGCRFDGPNDLRTLPASYIHRASEGHYAGTTHSERHAPFTTRAVFDGQPLPFPIDAGCSANTGCRADAYDFTNDGASIVGTFLLPDPWSAPGSSPLRKGAFLYPPTFIWTRLSDLRGGEEASGAYAISLDGRTIVGFGSDDGGQQALVWTDGTPYRADELVLRAGGTIPAGWQLRELRAMSADGKVWVGNGINPDGHEEGFRIVMPARR